MNFLSHRDRTNDSIEGMIVPVSKAPSMLYSKDIEVISPTTKEKKKSYLGPTPGERKQSAGRKSIIKESLGAFLAKGSENDQSEETEETVSYHGRTKSRRPRPAHAQASPAGAPSRSMSGGSIISAMHSASQAFTPQLPRRSMSGQAKNKADGRLDDPFIDALLGASTPSTHAMSYSTTTPSSRGAGSRKLWQGIGLDQFKEKMGYRKPGTPTEENTRPGRNTRSRSFDAAETAAAADANSDGTEPFGSRFLQRRSKSPCYLGDRLSSSARNSRSVDRALGGLSSSSHHSRSTSFSDTWDNNPTSASEHGTRSIDFHRREPRRTVSEELYAPAHLDRRHSSEHGRRTVGPPLPDAPPLGYEYTTPRPLRRGKKSAIQQDSFYGLQLEQEMENDDDSSRRTNRTKSPSSSHRRSNRSRSRESPHLIKLPSKKHSGAIRTPSSSRRKVKSVQHSPSSAASPSSKSSSRLRSVCVDSADGWGDLELDGLEDHVSLAASERQQQPFDGNVSYGEDIDTAMEVGENLMALGVQLLTRGSDIFKQATRRNSLIESAHGSPRGKSRDHANQLHTEHCDIEVEVGLGESLDQTLNRMKSWKAEPYDESQRSGVPSQILCDDDPEKQASSEDVDDDIESLAGVFDHERGYRKSSHSHRLAHSSSSASELGNSGNDISMNSMNSLNSLNSLMMMDSGSVSGGMLTEDEEMAAIMDKVHEDVHDSVPPLRRQSPDPSSLRINNESFNNSTNRFEDSWRGLEFDFSDLGAKQPAGKEKKERHKVGRSKSAGSEGMKAASTKGGKPPRRRSSFKTKANPVPKAPK